MNYIGSKKSLLSFLENSIYQIVDNKNFSFLDLFAGNGIVGQHFKSKKHKIIANDFMYYSFVLNKNYIENHKILKFNKLEKEFKELENIKIKDRANFICYSLDNIECKKGFIYNNYSLEGTSDKNYQRLYFTDKNAKKTDSIRQKIEYWNSKNLLTEGEYYFLLATLLENIDKVANTASVYSAFLKKIKKSAQKTFTMKPANFIINNNEHKVFNEDVETLINKIKGDVLYLDPPYNHRQYATNYHLLETIAKYDYPDIKGKTGLRDYNNQNFVEKNKYLKIYIMWYVINIVFSRLKINKNNEKSCYFR